MLQCPDIGDYVFALNLERKSIGKKKGKEAQGNKSTFEREEIYISMKILSRHFK